MPTGFTIVEAVVSAALLMISSIAIVSIFNSSISALRRSSEKDAISAAISADMAQVEKLNDYYTCSTGNCTVPPSPLPESPPTKFQYIPDSNSANAPAFKALCDGSGGANLSAGLVNNLNETTTINAGTTSNLLLIERKSILHPNNATGQHLYIVEWSPPQGPKRQIVLEPTVSNWCP